MIGRPDHVAELLGWANERSRIALEPLASPEQLASASFDLVVLDAEHVDDAVEVLLELDCRQRPEVIAIGLSSLEASRLRGRGLPLLIDVPGTWSVGVIGRAIEHALRARLPLRTLAVELVGSVELPEALALVRYAMLTQALACSGSKRGAARLLGVTRPAIQQMAKGYSVPPDSEPG